MMMRKILLLLFLQLWVGITVLSAQTASPQGFKYQAAAQVDGELITGSVGVQFTIREGSPNGMIIYQERQFPSANDNGVIAVTIGPRGSGVVVQGAFADIDWGNNDIFLQMELDPAGGADYINMGTSQILSVPYALYSETAASVEQESQALNLEGDTLSITSGNSIILPQQTLSIDGGRSLSISGGNSVTLPWKQFGTNVYRSSGNVGIGTSTPTSRLTVRSSVLVENSSGDDRALLALNSSNAGFLTLFGPNGNRNIEFSTLNNTDSPNRGALRMHNDEGNIRIFLGVDQVGAGAMSLTGPNGNTNIIIGTPGSSRPNTGAITLRDENGNTQVSLGIDGNGNGFVTADNITESSDRRLKENIRPLTNALAIIDQLNGVYFDYKDQQAEVPQVGVIAQEIQQILPSLVHERENGYLSVNYSKFTAILIEGVKEQQEEIAALKQQLVQQQQLLKQLSASVMQLQLSFIEEENKKEALITEK